MITDNMRCGIPFLVVGHYNCNCETYEFFGDVPEKLYKEGTMDTIPFADDCITMDAETYLKYVEKAHDFVELYREDSIGSLLARFEKAEDQCPEIMRNCRETMMPRTLYIICGMLRRFRR